MGIVLIVGLNIKVYPLYSRASRSCSREYSQNQWAVEHIDLVCVCVSAVFYCLDIVYNVMDFNEG